MIKMKMQQLSNENKIDYLQRNEVKVTAFSSAVLDPRSLKRCFKDLRNNCFKYRLCILIILKRNANIDRERLTKIDENILSDNPKKLSKMTIQNTGKSGS